MHTIGTEGSCDFTKAGADRMDTGRACSKLEGKESNIILFCSPNVPGFLSVYLFISLFGLSTCKLCWFFVLLVLSCLSFCLFACFVVIIVLNKKLYSSYQITVFPPNQITGYKV